ncbi:hypothetical protein ACGFIG_05635 [Micromonospora sp. NPDC049048]|uniref:hypothetical protein n=1 Tax=Micromonospora sp. NPDC049048 TaxID=3364263 RepID=UPI0037209535
MARIQKPVRRLGGAEGWIRRAWSPKGLCADVSVGDGPAWAGEWGATTTGSAETGCAETGTPDTGPAIAHGMAGGPDVGWGTPETGCGTADCGTPETGLSVLASAATGW